MTPEQTLTAREFLSCEYWHWMPGMLGVRGDEEWRAVRKVRGGWVFDSGGPSWDGDESELIPDITDPATLGCILHLVQYAWEGSYTVSAPAMLQVGYLLAALAVAELKGVD